jgi:pimeloyl-ACP methyl ester carboxylesterase
LATREVGLATHIQDVVNVLEFEDLKDVVLVGNSSGGMVITGVAEVVPQRIAQLVYLDAFVPEDGESLLDIIPAERRPVMETMVQKDGAGWLLPRFAPPPWEKFLPEAWQITDKADLDWVLPRLRPTPFGHFTKPVQRKNPATRKLLRTYIRCQWPNASFDRYAEVARNSADWRYRDLAASHISYVTHPGALADLLIEVAA